MDPGADHKPECGDRFGKLGVRVPKDIPVDPTGCVAPQKGGLSVFLDDLTRIPISLREPRHKNLSLRPIFSIELRCLGGHLAFSPDPMRPEIHGYIEPSIHMTLSEYQVHLCETRILWEAVP